VQAIDRTGDTTTALVAGAGGRLETRTVTLGIESPDRVEVRSGLTENDLVVIGSRAQLKAGAIVSPRLAVLPPIDGAR
jgi:multidrug efflux pump subunit AcrA (membrane-fusion protein)